MLFQIPRKAEMRADAGQVLGSPWIDAVSASRKYALRRQHLLRRGALRQPALYFRLRHRLPAAWPSTGGRRQGERHTDVRARLRLALPLGSHSRHALLPAALWNAAQSFHLSLLKPHAPVEASHG